MTVRTGYEGYKLEVVAAAIKKIRQYQGYNAAEFERKAELKANTIRDVETAYACSAERALLISEKLGFSSISEMVQEAKKFPDYDKQSLSFTTKILRLYAGITATAFAKKLGNSRVDHFSEFEKEGSRLSEAKIAKIPELLGYNNGYKAWPQMIERAKELAPQMERILSERKQPPQDKIVLERPFDLHVVSGMDVERPRWIDAYLQEKAKVAVISK